MSRILLRFVPILNRNWLFFAVFSCFCLFLSQNPPFGGGYPPPTHPPLWGGCFYNFPEVLILDFPLGFGGSPTPPREIFQNFPIFRVFDPFLCLRNKKIPLFGGVPPQTPPRGGLTPPPGGCFYPQNGHFLSHFGLFSLENRVKKGQIFACYSVKTRPQRGLLFIALVRGLYLTRTLF